MTVKTDIQQLATWLREFEGDAYSGQVSELEEAKVNLAVALAQQSKGQVSDATVLAAAKWVTTAEAEVAAHPVTLINNLDDKLGVLSIAEDMHTLLQRIVAAYPWGSDEPIDGADLVDYAAEWVEQVKMVMAKAEA